METQKNRMETLLNKNGIKQIDLLKTIYSRLGYKDPYAKAEKEKSNFSKMISGERNFPIDFIIPLEVILQASYRYMITGESENYAFEPKGIRYTAYTNNYLQFAKMDSEIINNLKVIKQSDEYGKTILDYIIQFDSIEGLRFLIDKEYIKLNYFKFDAIIGEIYATDHDNIVELIFKLIFKNDDAILFTKFFNAFHIAEYSLNNDDFVNNIANDDFLILLLNSNHIFQCLFKDEFIDLNSSIVDSDNKKYSALFCNPLLFYLLNYVLLHHEINEKKLIQILEYAIDYNKRAIEYICKKSELDFKRMKITSDGFIKIGYNLCGNLMTYEIRSQLDLNKKIQDLLTQINRQINELEFGDRILLGGLSNKSVRLENGYLIKKASNNTTEYQFLEILQKENFSFSPRYFGQTDGIDRFEYKEGKTESQVFLMPIDKIEQVLSALKLMNAISHKYLSDNRVYVHGDLSSSNVVFKNNKLVSFIDWDCTRIGEEYEDLIYIFWTWLNIGSKTRNNEEIFDRLNYLMKYYDAPVNLKQNFADKMIKVMNDRLDSSNEKDLNYKRIYEWVGWSKIWVELYKTRIGEEIG